MLKLKKFDEDDYIRYPYVENLCDEIVPRLARVKMGSPAFEGMWATVVVDANGIQVMIYNKAGDLYVVFVRELYPFSLALFVAEHLDEPLDPGVLIGFGFERFK